MRKRTHSNMNDMEENVSHLSTSFLEIIVPRLIESLSYQIKVRTADVSQKRNAHTVVKILDVLEDRIQEHLELSCDLYFPASRNPA